MEETGLSPRGTGTTVGRTVSTVCVMIVEVGVSDTYETKVVTTSKVVVNEDVVNLTPEQLAAKADTSWS